MSVERPPCIRPAAAATSREECRYEAEPEPVPRRHRPRQLNPDEIMRSSSSELLLDQQQELRRKKLLELVAAPKKKKPPKRTCRQRARFYATSIVALTAVSAGSSLLFLVPLYVDPAISTLAADFVEHPVKCVTTRREDRSGIFNCTWSSCREGCTSDMYKCTHIYVSYEGLFSEDPRRISDSLSSTSMATSSTLDINSSTSVTDPSPTSGYLDTPDEAVLLVNIKGCGYPPDIDCGNFTDVYGVEGVEFPCYFSKENRTVVMTHYDRNDQVEIIINYFAVPFVVTVVTSVVLCIMHCRCTGQPTRIRRPRIENAR